MMTSANFFLFYYWFPPLTLFEEISLEDLLLFFFFKKSSLFVFVFLKFFSSFSRLRIAMEFAMDRMRTVWAVMEFEEAEKRFFYNFFEKF